MTMSANNPCSEAIDLTMQDPSSKERVPSVAVIENSPKKGLQRAASKPVRTRFTNDEEAILLKEVIAAGAHVAAYGKKEKAFDCATGKINDNPHFRHEVKTRAVQEKFCKMVKEFRARDNKDRKKSGVSDNLSETDALLACIVDAVDDAEELENVEKQKATEAETRKIKAGERMVAQANGSGSSCDADATGATVIDSADDEEEGRARKRRRKQPAPAPVNDGLATFSESMRETELAKVASARQTELAKVDLETKRLAFEEKRHQDLMEDRAQQRAMEAADREVRNKADMDRLQAMLDFATKSIHTARRNE